MFCCDASRFLYFILSNPYAVYFFLLSFALGQIPSAAEMVIVGVSGKLIIKKFPIKYVYCG